MLFTPKNATRVMCGEKTQTRREKQPGDTAIMKDGKIVAVERNKRLLWEVERSYAVQPGRGKPSIGRIWLTEIRCQSLQDISEADICAELGCPTQWPGPGPEPYKRNLREAFANLWDSINGKAHRWNDNNTVWALTIRLPKPEERVEWAKSQA